MNIKNITAFLLFISLGSFADMHWIKSDKVNPEEVQQAKIVYFGEVNARQVAELISAIEEINNDYPATKLIRLYISSFGGSMESAYLAMQAVKGSVIPVETINAGMIASAATLIYCGADKRYTFPQSSFVLHPSAAPNLKTDWIRPNDIDLMKKDVDDGNKFFRSAYKKCTSLSSAEIDKVLYSNDSARYFLANEAKTIKLSQGEISGITPTPVSYYITDEKS
ncbi:ATP-dependent Clp protease proteolytic subunit [Pantoea sp. AS142]|uniref:ATP-dependent Clp protease proteolytic subunit n=1 Tax=Pantoea sp. AS142 TaxID=3081292 RepID=UPI00301A69C1